MKYRLLTSLFFLAGPYRVGRFGLAITRRPVWPQTYRAEGLWRSLDVAWLRFYLWDRQAARELDEDSMHA